MSHVFMIVDFNSICRFCLESKGVLSNIFDTDDETSLVSQIVELTDIEVVLDDDMPTKVCHRCRFKIEQSFDFKTMIHQSQKALKDSIYDINKCDTKDFVHNTDTASYEAVEFLSSRLEGGNIVEDSNISYSDSQEQYETIRNNEIEDNSDTTVQYVLPNLFEDVKVLNYVENEATVDNHRSNKMNDDANGLEDKILNHNQYPSIFAAHKKNQCLLCLKKYSNTESLHNHVDSHVRGTNLEPYYKCKDRNIYCKVCCKFFDYRFTFLTHQREHLNIKPFVCLYPNCNAAYLSNAVLRQHMQIHAGKQFICATCGIGFKRKTDLRGHEIIHEDANRKYSCELCGLICKNRLTYGHHVKKHHTQPKYKCDHCPKEYFSRSELTRHLYSHSSVKKFQCSLCSCAYFSQSALKRHIRCHDQPKVHKCFICSVVCNSWGEFMDHRKQHISEQCPFKCPYCDKGYFVKPSLTRHIGNCPKKPEADVMIMPVKTEMVQQQELIIDMIESIEQDCDDATIEEL